MLQLYLELMILRLECLGAQTIAGRLVTFTTYKYISKLEYTLLYYS
jgi:hypothetical protein